MRWVLLHPQATPDHLGFIPSFISENDPRPAAEQLNANYIHGGGWRPQSGFTLATGGLALKYPGDPPFRPLASTWLRDELVVVYDCALVAVIQRDRSFEVCRMD